MMKHKRKSSWQSVSETSRRRKKTTRKTRMTITKLFPYAHAKV